MAVQAMLGNVGNAAKGGVVLLSSMAPFVENKGSILLAAALHLKWYLAYFASSVGSFLPVPFLLHLGENGKKRLHDSRLGNSFFSSADNFVGRHRSFFDRYGCFALLVIVSLPFTGVGCWAAAFLSKVAGLDRRQSAAAIFVGIVVSGLLTTAAAYGLFWGASAWLKAIF